MKKITFCFSLLILCIFCGCSENNDFVVYRKFKDQTWSRFDVLHFEIPVEPSQKLYDVSLFVNYTKEYEFDNLDFNMIMTTPSGEERIKEYNMDIRRKDGQFIGRCSKDSYEVSIALKKGLRLTKGILDLEIENLIPRLQTKGLQGIGIRLHPL
jgi:gliding motility-associated lipoprotein GldH